MKKTIYELLGMVKNDNVDYEYVKYCDRIKEKDDIMLACKENIIYKLEYGNIELDDIVEILEEPKGIPEKITTFYDDTLEEYIAETRINGNKTKEHYGSPFEQMIIDKINEIIEYLESKGE